MSGFAIYPKWFWITLIAIVVVACIIDLQTAPGYMVLLAFLLPILRFGYLHPLSGTNLHYYHWLRTVPFDTSKPLPNGSIHPAWADLLVLMILCIPSCFGDKYPGPIVSMIFIVTALVLSYTLVTIALLFKVGPVWLGYVHLAFICVALRITWSIDPAATPYVYFITPAIAFVISAIGQWLVMKRFPWPHINLEQVNNRGRLNSIYGHHDLLELGEPYASLTPRAGFQPVRWVHRIGVSLLCGLLVLLFHRFVYDTRYFPIAVIFFVAIVLRWHFYLSNKTMGGFVNSLRFLWQDIKMRRWNQNAMLSVLILAGLAAGTVNLLRLLPMTLSFVLAPILTALVILAVYLIPPSRREWDLTGKWQLRMNPMNYVTKPKAQILRLEKSE